MGELHRAIKPEKVTCQWQIFEIMESMTIAKCTTVLPQPLHLRRRWRHLFSWFACIYFCSESLDLPAACLLLLACCCLPEGPRFARPCSKLQLFHLFHYNGYREVIHHMIHVSSCVGSGGKSLTDSASQSLIWYKLSDKIKCWFCFAIAVPWLKILAKVAQCLLSVWTLWFNSLHSREWNSFSSGRSSWAKINK